MAKIEPTTLIKLFEELRNERIIVRPYLEKDAAMLHEAVNESREHIRPWLPFADEHQTVDDSVDWIVHSRAKWLLRTEMNLSIWDATRPDRYLGGISITHPNWDIRCFEIGYWLRASAVGKGYMSEAVRLVANFAFTQLNANRVEIRCDELNIHSASVARRLGFTQEACLRHDRQAHDGGLTNTLIFGCLPGELL